MQRLPENKISNSSAAVNPRRIQPLLFYCDKDSFSTYTAKGSRVAAVSSSGLEEAILHVRTSEAVGSLSCNKRVNWTSGVECGTNLRKKKSQLSLTCVRRRMNAVGRLKE
jgi:hypothetical protein